MLDRFLCAPNTGTCSSLGRGNSLPLMGSRGRSCPARSRGFSWSEALTRDMNSDFYLAVQHGFPSSSLTPAHHDLCKGSLTQQLTFQPAFGIMACRLPLRLKSYGSGVHTRVTCSPSHLHTHSLCRAPRQDTGGPSMTWVMGGHEAPCLASVVPGDNPQKTTVRNQDHSQSLAAQVYPGTDYMFHIIIKSKYPCYWPCAGILFSVDGNPAVLH